MERAAYVTERKRKKSDIEGAVYMKKKRAVTQHMHTTTVIAYRSQTGKEEKNSRISRGLCAT